MMTGEPGIHENGTINCERPFAGATVTERDATDIRGRVCETMAGANGYLQEQDHGKKRSVREAGFLTKSYMRKRPNFSLIFKRKVI
jgi:hypothetical protein